MPVSPARATAFDILMRVETQGAYASELLHSERLDKLSPADRGLTMEIVMGVLRWRSRLDEEVAAASSRATQKLDVEVLTGLRIGTYQLHELSRVPARAAINESVELVKRARKRSAAPFANAVLRKIADTRSGKTFLESAITDAALASLAGDYAHPEWLVQRWMQRYGPLNAARICTYDQHVPRPALRFESSQVIEELAGEPVELIPGALLTSARIVAAGDVTQTRAFREGRVFIQDEASQLVAMLVGSGSRMLDCCAAPGGKTAAIAARNPTAEIVAAELHAHRAELLRSRVRAANVQVIQADALKLPHTGGFDRVLADVPCSGTGTLARNPEIKWRLKLEDLADLHQRQVAILRAALGQLAPGGRAVYSTCSLEPEENEAVVEEALSRTAEFKVLDCRQELERLQQEGEIAWHSLDSLLSGPYLRTIPGWPQCDGFFAAIIERVP